MNKVPLPLMGLGDLINKGVSPSVAKTGKGVVCVQPGSKRERKMVQAKGARIADDSNIPADIKAHNDAIEAKRQEKLARRKARV